MRPGPFRCLYRLSGQISAVFGQKGDLPIHGICWFGALTVPSFGAAAFAPADDTSA